MLVSVVIPVYNGIGVIENCLDSLLDYSGQHKLDIIVIDDFSSDGSREYLKSKENKFTIIYNEQNLNYAASVNRGIEMAKGKAILLLNQDTIVPREAIDHLSDKLFSIDNYAIVAPRLVNPDKSLQRSIRSFPNHLDIISHHLGLNLLNPDSARFNHWKQPHFNYENETEVEQPMFSAVMFKCEVIEKVGLLDLHFPLFFNDVDYCHRVIAAGYKIIFTPKVEVVHVHGQATSQIAVRSVYLHHQAFIDYLNKNFKGIRNLIPNLICSILLVASAHVRAVALTFKKIFISRA